MSKSRLLIAVVDDEECVRKSLRRFLRAFGLQAVTFASGQEFLSSLPGCRPDCLVLDLQMPGLSGAEVQRQLAASGAHIPTIIITAADDPETRARCLAAGSAAYLSKPVDGQVLLALIERATSAAPQQLTLAGVAAGIGPKTYA